MCDPEIVNFGAIPTPTREEITVGRLKKKIKKLQQQRDFYKNKYTEYRNILNAHPSYERHSALRKRYDDMQIAMGELVIEIGEKATRIKEQSELIKRLLGEDC